MSSTSSSEGDVFSEPQDDRSNVNTDEVEYANCRMEQLPCYHEATSRGKSEVLLENAPEGCFLIRSSTEVGNYSVSVRTANAVRHFRIDHDGDRYNFGQALFWSPVQIWEHLQQKPVLECDEDVKVQLLHPYYNEDKIDEPDSGKYCTIERHYIPDEEIVKKTTTERGKRASTSSIGSITSHITTSLEGELFKKKQGKNWKRRWCMLRGNYLSYKKSEGTGRLLRKLDLAEAIEVKEDYDELLRKNCFRIIFPDVYFIFSSELATDKYVWFKRIQRQIDANKC